MKRTIGNEIDNIESSTEIERIIAFSLSRILDREPKNSSSVSVTFKEVARQLKVITDPLTQQLSQLCDLVRESKNKQDKKGHNRAASSTSGTGSRSDSTISILQFFLGKRASWRSKISSPNFCSSFLFADGPL